MIFALVIIILRVASGKMHSTAAFVYTTATGYDVTCINCVHFCLRAKTYSALASRSHAFTHGEKAWTTAYARVVQLECVVA